MLLSVRDHIDDGPTALQDVDDQLVKPFPPNDLIERVRKFHGTTAKPSGVYNVGDLEVDTAGREARRDGVPLALTAREFAALELLAANLGTPVSDADLIDHMWGERADPPTAALGMVIRLLRLKLRPAVLVRRARDFGYVLTVEQASAVRDVPIPITIYLSNEFAHQQVQAAVEGLIDAAGAHIVDRDDPVWGSWFRRMWAKTRTAAESDLARNAAHALDSRLVLAQDATVTATMMQNLGPLLSALQPTKDAVIRVGALLIVKVDWTVAVHQLTAAQQLLLDHHPQLLTSPHDILDALHPPTDGTADPQVAYMSHPTTTPHTNQDNHKTIERSATHPTSEFEQDIQ